jgi:hypothetical protein
MLFYLFKNIQRAGDIEFRNWIDSILSNKSNVYFTDLDRFIKHVFLLIKAAILKIVFCDFFTCSE